MDRTIPYQAWTRYSLGINSPALSSNLLNKILLDTGSDVTAISHALVKEDRVITPVADNEIQTLLLADRT